MTEQLHPGARRFGARGRVLDEQIARDQPFDLVERTLTKMLRKMTRMLDEPQAAGLSPRWSTLELTEKRDERCQWTEYRMLLAAEPGPPLDGFTVREAPMLRDGRVINMGDVMLIGTHPLTPLEAAGREARLTVRRGLADVLEWLGRPVENEPTGAEVFNLIHRGGRPA
jgi:hypothetical protein